MRKFTLALKLNLTILLLTLLSFCSCRAKKEVTEDRPKEDVKSNREIVDLEDEERMRGPQESSPKNSRIIGKVLKIYSVGDTLISLPKCDIAPCLADIQLMGLAYRSNTFHGQYNEGDTLTVAFSFTLEPTEERFPELNQPLPGLKESEWFEAELFEFDGNKYRIQLYEKKG